MVPVILPWQASRWGQIVSRLDSLPHALLLTGPAGQGKRQFAEALAALLLCESPDPGPLPCGRCTGCQWRLAENHPDLQRVVPEADEEGDDEGEGGEPAKGKSAQILIAQIRALQEAFTITSHRGGRRVVIVDPAEAMNVYTANALLKLLEEPPAGAVFLLISAQPLRLLPTLRSRCQRWDFPLPGAEVVLPWLTREHPDTPPALLALAGGAPLAAAQWARRGGEGLRTRFARDLAGLTVAETLRLAGQWEAWVKSKEALAAGLDMATLIGWFQRWVTDLVSLRLGGRVRFFPDQEGVLAALAVPMSEASAAACYNDALALRRVAQHPLNPRLLLEDMLLRYVRALQGGAP
ncbi:MAG: DNA polymerase III subunit delta' [Rhodocyclaceae bacterium]|jgi:DNA polymerase-3 subunit delta'|nr:DNA polymerase III subunit delta' [Rhodocyclaceae bacterium]